MEASFSKYEDLHQRFDMLTHSGSNALSFGATELRLLREIDKVSSEIRETKTTDKLDMILIDELTERLEILKIIIELPTDREFSYEKVLRSIGINADTVKSVATHFGSKNY